MWEVVVAARPGHGGSGAVDLGQGVTAESRCGGWDVQCACGNIGVVDGVAPRE